MKYPQILLLVCLLGIANQTSGDQLPVHRFDFLKLLKNFTYKSYKPINSPIDISPIKGSPINNRLIKVSPIRDMPIRVGPIVPIHLLPVTHKKFVVPTSRPIIDGNGNFVAPGELVKDCILAEDKLFDKCKRDGAKKFNLGGGEDSTVWESCCAAYSELSCYQHNAKTFCPKANLVAFLLYTNKVAKFFQGSICKTMDFGMSDWKRACEQKTADMLSQQHQNDKFKGNKASFSLPPDHGPEKSCLTKLRRADGGKTNYEKICGAAAGKKYDPSNDKWTKTPIRDICYQTFDVMECLRKQSLQTCTEAEQKDYEKYRQTSLTIFDTSLCANFTSKSYQDSLTAPPKRDLGKSDSSRVLDSVFIAIFTFLIGYLFA